MRGSGQGNVWLWAEVFSLRDSREAGEKYLGIAVLQYERWSERLGVGAFLLGACRFGQSPGPVCRWRGDSS